MPFNCTFRGCQETFPGAEALIIHKQIDDAHDFCHICDLDCADWDALSAHKATLSGRDVHQNTEEDYKEGRAARTNGNNHGKGPFHPYTCQHCGEENATPDGITRHLRKVHPKEKKLFCPACQSSFLRVSAIIKHLEDDQCRGVHGIRFALWMRRVDLLNALVAGAEHAQDTLRNGYKEFSADCLKKFNGGGLMDPVTKVDMSDAKEWPSLPTHKKESNPAPTGNKDLDSPATGKLQLHKTPKPPEPKKPPAPKQVGRIRVDFDPYNWPPAEDELMGELTKGFPPDTYLIKNLLPSHREADPERFYNKLLNRYYCDRCDWYAHTAVKLEAHRLFQHATEKIECPRCHKEFKTYYSLMTHVESENTRCSLAATCRLGQAAQIAAELELRTGKAQIETGRFNWKAYLKYME